MTGFTSTGKHLLYLHGNLLSHNIFFFNLHVNNLIMIRVTIGFTSRGEQNVTVNVHANL